MTTLRLQACVSHRKWIARQRPQDQTESSQPRNVMPQEKERQAGDAQDAEDADEAVYTE